MTTEYRRGKWHHVTYTEVITLAHSTSELEATESAFMILAEEELENYKQARRPPEETKWKEVCQQEYNNLTGYHTWMLMDQPPNINIVDSHWMFRVKRDNLGHVNKYKARLVAKGFSQIPGVDFNETYSPAIHFTTICLIIALVCKYSLKLRQLDIKGAYLNGILEETVYMKQPKGFIRAGDEDKVCKLHESLCGLKESGRVWHQTLKELEKMGFTSGKANNTVFFRLSGS